MKKQFATLVLILTLSLSACALPIGPSATPTPVPPTFTPEPPTATPEPAAVTVNGEAITVAEFQAELARYKASQSALGLTPTEEEANKTVLDDLVDQLLLAQGARAANLSMSDADLQSRVDALAQTMGGADKLAAWESAQGYTDVSFRSALKREAEAAQMRDKIIADVPGTMEQVHVRQILLYNADTAQRLLEQLQAGAAFSDLAGAYDPQAHGDLGWFPRGYLFEPKIEEAAFALQPGQFSDVIQTEVGYHILYMVERGPHPLSPDALLVMQEQAVRAWLEQQRQQAAIVLAP